MPNLFHSNLIPKDAMTSQSQSPLKVVFGAFTFGNHAEHSRVTDLSEAGQILDIFQSFGHNEVDTSRFYGDGSSEQHLAKLGWKSRGLVVDTKLYPTAGRHGSAEQWTHSPADLREGLRCSLKALDAKIVHLWYLHGPDRTTPYIDTLREVNNLHKEGLFDQFGISNYMSWEVAQICEICEAHGWVKPIAYQGIYNALHRTVEAELLPCLRNYGMGLYAFNPLAGGFLTGKISKELEVEKGSRFDEDTVFGKRYRERYCTDEHFRALEIVRVAAEKAGLTMAEVALRWMTHHSKLRREYNDAVLVGASR